MDIAVPRGFFGLPTRAFRLAHCVKNCRLTRMALSAAFPDRIAAEPRVSSTEGISYHRVLPVLLLGLQYFHPIIQAPRILGTPDPLPRVLSRHSAG